MSELGPAEVRERLGLPGAAMPWLDRAATLLPARALALPGDAEAERLLRRLGVRPEDRAETLAARPDPAAHPALWWVLELAHRELVTTMGATDKLPWPDLPGAGALGGHGYVWVFLAAVPEVRAYHAARGIPGDVSWATLCDLGQQMGVHRRIFGTGGLHTQRWLTLPYRGALYELGRLQFNRHAIWFDDAPAPAGVRAPRRGDRAVGVHIPERGRLDPAACDESIGRAREFFPRHFPDEPVRYATCVSWLLDEQLTEYLPEHSNVVRFLRRFYLVPQPASRSPERPAWTRGDRSVVEFVFRRVHAGADYPPELIEALPRHTMLQRAIVDHLRAGRHWHVRTGWFLL